MSDRPIPPLESLLAHRRWVRAVARRLVRDEHAAEDLAQETWVRALRSPPDPERDPKPWLRRVLKNLASNRRRGEARRTKRETAWREGRAQRSPAELVAEAEQHKRLVNLVLDLEEPFKTALVLRFYEGLGPTEIAQRLGIPVGTVHSRIARATERLKERLDAEEDGDRAKWIAALMPLAGFERIAPAATASTATTSLAGILLMTCTKPNVAFVVLLLLGGLVGGAFWLASDSSGDDSDRADLLTSHTDRGPELETRGTLRAQTDGPRAAPTAAVGTATADTLRGRVLDAEGKPVAGALIIALPAGSPGIDDRDLAKLGVRPPRSGADGTFAFDGRDIPADAQLVIHAPGRAPATIALAGRDRTDALDVRLPEPWRVTLRVEDANGVWPAGTLVDVDSIHPESLDHAADPKRQGTWHTVEPADEDAQPERMLTIPSRAAMRAIVYPPKGLAAVPPYVEFAHPTDEVAFRLVPSGRLALRVVRDADGKPLDDSERLSVWIGKRKDNLAAWSFGGRPRDYDIDTRLAPGAYDIEIRGKGYAVWKHSLKVREPGDVQTIVARLKPDPGTVKRGRLLLRVTAGAQAPEDVLALARASGTPKVDKTSRYRVMLRMTQGDLEAWRKVWGQGWADADLRRKEDGRFDVQFSTYTMQDPHIPAGTYDVYVAERATGRAAVVRGVRVFGDQDNEAQVRVEPGSFVRLARLVDRTKTWKHAEVRAGTLGAIPLVAFYPDGSSVFTGPHHLRYLLDAPLRDIVLGPFPAAEVDVVVTDTDDKQHTFRVRGTQTVTR